MAKHGHLARAGPTCSDRPARPCSTRWTSQGVYGLRVESLRDLLEIYDRELTMVEREMRRRCQRSRRLQGHPSDHRCRAGHGRPSSWPRSATCTRFPTARHLCSWAGLTPKLRESDTKSHRGHITKMACGAASPSGAGSLPSGGDRDDHRWARHPSSPTHIRLRGHDHRRGPHRPDRSCEPRAVAQMVGTVRRHGRGRVRVGGLHGLALCRRGNGGSRGHRPCGRAGGDGRPAGEEEQSQNRPG